MGMKKLQIYIDTSVVGGCFDKEFEEFSNKLFDRFKEGVYMPVVSSNLVAELAGAPDTVKAKLKEISYEEVAVNDEMTDLAQKYMLEKIVSDNYYDDALHIAIATVLKIDVLVSWNFKHIVNLNKIIRFNAVNIREGYGHLEIRSPRDLIERGE
jgi:predicted nucleic acid-binding protein